LPVLVSSFHATAVARLDPANLSAAPSLTKILLGFTGRAETDVRV
jgi:hypothetical protein